MGLTFSLRCKLRVTMTIENVFNIKKTCFRYVYNGIFHLFNKDITRIKKSSYSICNLNFILK